MKNQLRQIPPIHELQRTVEFNRFISSQNLSFEIAADLVKESVAHIRTHIQQEIWDGPLPESDLFIHAVITLATYLKKEKLSLSLLRVINASGTILHTNLGRARLGQETIEHMCKVTSSYNNLEYEVQNGKRGSRHAHAEKFIRELTGAEAAMVVNNNAAAVFLILTSLAKNKEVIVSRGELVEIGGSFRISSIMEESGAKLVEVGTTNKTHLQDYQRCIDEETAMIMKVHQSNFVMKGFTSSVDTEVLAELTNEYDQVIFYEDLGSGSLFDFSNQGIGNEPVVRKVIEQGADLVSFSGDKLLGGPQAGIIAGRKEIVDSLKKHQLARVLRVDKMTLAALEMTLLHYLKKEEHKIPAIYDITRSKDDILQQSLSLMAQLKQKNSSFQLEIVEGKSRVGGGTMPEVELDTYLISIFHNRLTNHELHEQLRLSEPSIITRIQQERLLIDLRTVSIGEHEEILEVLDTIHEELVR
ncbi:L-seryl-tRNA(Sec) selenium transferase [Bacillus haikouensis]|uniref:L-seryl-tRNA(Sec) selenium transferase n=1 Tax=Bacillus haikouensis TaxID=1510468 RepID=UPI001555D230|nr:L-seryl-tRNA(Sec) selenium transferase [Bacillus haikouensis]NQD65064.1 L-seryl-tRNA(Sec) selenium transferase [Bacillus haikouensis]